MIGPERAVVPRACALAIGVRPRGRAHDAVKRARPPLPFAHQLYREEVSPREL